MRRRSDTTLRPVDRHEVDDLGDARLREEPRHEDRACRACTSASSSCRRHRRQREAAAPAVVQQRREHAGRVEPGAAEPVDRPVGRDERGALQIADQSVVCDGRIAHVGLLAATARTPSRPSGRLHGPWRLSGSNAVKPMLLRCACRGPAHAFRGGRHARRRREIGARSIADRVFSPVSQASLMLDPGSSGQMGRMRPPTATTAVPPPDRVAHRWLHLDPRVPGSGPCG